jgi:hypothetical protein
MASVDTGRFLIFIWRSDGVVLDIIQKRVLQLQGKLQDQPSPFTPRGSTTTENREERNNFNQKKKGKGKKQILISHNEGKILESERGY